MRGNDIHKRSTADGSTSQAPLSKSAIGESAKAISFVTRYTFVLSTVDSGQIPLAFSFTLPRISPRPREKSAII